MIAKLIRWSISNRVLVLLASVLLAAWGAWSLSTTPLDAIPRLFSGCRWVSLPRAVRWRPLLQGRERH